MKDAKMFDKVSWAIVVSKFLYSVLKFVWITKVKDP